MARDNCHTARMVYDANSSIVSSVRGGWKVYHMHSALNISSKCSFLAIGVSSSTSCCFPCSKCIAADIRNESLWRWKNAILYGPRRYDTSVRGSNWPNQILSTKKVTINDRRTISPSFYPLHFGRNDRAAAHCPSSGILPWYGSLCAYATVRI